MSSSEFHWQAIVVNGNKETEFRSMRQIGEDGIASMSDVHGSAKDLVTVEMIFAVQIFDNSIVDVQILKHRG